MKTCGHVKARAHMARLYEQTTTRKCTLAHAQARTSTAYTTITAAEMVKAATCASAAALDRLLLKVSRCHHWCLCGEQQVSR